MSRDLNSSETLDSGVPKKAVVRKERRLRRWLRRFLYFVGVVPLCIGLYVAAAWVLGNIPANASFVQTADGVEIAVLNNGVHCDLVVPLESEVFRWRGFLVPSHRTAHEERFHYALIGWGNRRFYLETQTWDDFKLSNALSALAGLGETVVHVDCLEELPRSSESCRRIRISKEQYRALCESVKSSFAGGEARNPRRIPNPAYSQTDAFFEGTGAYHVFNTCNVWTGRNLQKAGVRVGWWTPFASTLFNSLPKELPSGEVLLGYGFDLSADGVAW